MPKEWKTFMRQRTKNSTSILRGLLLAVLIVMGVPAAIAQATDAKAASGQAAQCDTVSALRFDSLTIDLGTITHEQPIRRFDIMFRNASPQRAVRIVRTEVSCACTTVGAPKDAMAPGQTGRLDVQLDMSPYDYGRFIKDIFVYTDDSSRPIEIVLTGYLARKASSGDD